MSKPQSNVLGTSTSVFDFLSYKDYLQAIYQSLKAEHGHSYSFKQFAVDLGLSESNVAWLYVSGRRQVSLATAKTIAQALRLSGDSRKYFLLLIPYSNTRKQQQRDKVLAQLIDLKKKSLTSTEQLMMAYFSEWYYPILREMVEITGFQGDPQWITKKLYHKLMPKEITRGLALLENLALIKRDGQSGQYSRTGGDVTPAQRLNKLAASGYHQKMIAMSAEAIAQVPARRRDFNSMTVSLDDSSRDMIKAMVQDFFKKVLELEKSTEHPTDIYQINLQLFALTKDEG